MTKPDPNQDIEEGTGAPYGKAATGTTGRYLVLFREGAAEEGARLLKRAAGMRAMVTAAVDLDEEEAAAADAVVFARLGVAVTSAPPEEPHTIGARIQALRDADRGKKDKLILAVEPERIVRALGTKREIYADDDAASWGLQAIGALKSEYTGRGVKVAVLDTGMDLKHPDFQGRELVHKSFVKRQDVQDKIGHGTHCVGTACGPRQPANPKFPRRYGVAGEALIHAGKVLGNNGFGDDRDVLAGIEWALASGCRVISMSLGAEAQPGDPYSQIFETVARRAQAAGALIVAAAGNESDRERGKVAPVGHPANCPSIMAVAALDDHLRVADFSNGGTKAEGGAVDIAAPGFRVWSSYPKLRKYARFSGTSMATPHVAGVAALLIEATPRASAAEIFELIKKKARKLKLPAADVGAGLVQAP